MAKIAIISRIPKFNRSFFHLSPYFFRIFLTFSLFFSFFFDFCAKKELCIRTIQKNVVYLRPNADGVTAHKPAVQQNIVKKHSLCAQL